MTNYDLANKTKKFFKDNPSKCDITELAIKKELKDMWDNSPCCIASTAIKIMEIKPSDLGENLQTDTAVKLFGLPNHDLFFLHKWPENFRKKLPKDNTKSVRTLYVDTVCEVIDHFMKSIPKIKI